MTNDGLIESVQDELERLLPTVPRHMREGITQYILTGRPVGGFLTALLENDLYQAVLRADDANIACLRVWVQLLQMAAPSDCYGTPAKVKAWCARGGLAG